ncbi:hypothetical protein AHAS_Ahas12G0118700 [Arachis hypogaea]
MCSLFVVTINEEQAESGIVIIVTSTAQSKFKLLYFEQDANGGYGLALHLAMAKDPERAFFKRLEGDNFFKTASYTIEVVCEKSYEDTTQKLNDIEAQISRKRNELRQFEAKYRNVTICFTQSWLMVYQALARYQKVTERYVKEKQSVCSFNMCCSDNCISGNAHTSIIFNYNVFLT